MPAYDRARRFANNSARASIRRWPLGVPVPGSREDDARIVLSPDVTALAFRTGHPGRPRSPGRDPHERVPRPARARRTPEEFRGKPARSPRYALGGGGRRSDRRARLLVPPARLRISGGGTGRRFRSDRQRSASRPKRADAALGAPSSRTCTGVRDRSRRRCVTVLYAFRQGFYGKHGYAATTPARRLRIHPASIPAAWGARTAGCGDRAPRRASDGVPARGRPNGDRARLRANRCARTHGWLVRPGGAAGAGSSPTSGARVDPGDGGSARDRVRRLVAVAARGARGHAARRTRDGRGR